MPRGYNIQGGRPSSDSGGDAGGSYGEVSRGRAVVEVVVAILIGLIVTIYIYLLAHGHGNPASLFSLALICEYGEWGAWSECYAVDPKRPLGADGSILPGVKHRSRPLLQSSNHRVAFHRCQASEQMAQVCTPTGIHGGGIVNIVEDVADINLVGRDARGAAAVASSSGAPLLKPVRADADWCKIGPWGDWSPCAGCGLVIQRREREVEGKLCPNNYEARACEGLQDCPPGSNGAATQAPFTTPIYNNYLKLNCNNSKEALIYLDGAPFAKGYAKTAWRALYNGKEVVVKRPIDSAKISRFVKGIDWEDKWFEYLNHPYISQYHGVCRDKENAFEVVEGGLAKWSFVADNAATPWCLRLRMAMQTLELTLYLLSHAIIHCDWKYDQTAIDAGGNLKLVDVKSLRRLEFDAQHNRRPYKSKTTCEHGSTCKKCMKMAPDLIVEHACNHTSKKCHGYGEKGMTYSTSLLFFRHLFRAEVFKDAPSLQFQADLDTMFVHAEASSQTARWTLQQLSDHLQAMHDRHGAAACLQDDARIREVVKAAYKDMTTGYADRCKKRYC